ncbi:MAG: 3-hydroxyacyl-ACP dehydratase FabZ family protein [Pirellulales bacterium]|jgi:3-hydroxyacyl-[acyl-carrier-protein] dehydratase
MTSESQSSAASSIPSSGTPLDPAILAAIPHRPPMLLVDEVVTQTADHIVCRKTFRPDEYFCQGHYPGNPIIPGVILCETALQTGAILLSRQTIESGGVPVATRLNDVKFKRIVRPGETIQIEVSLTDRLADAYFMTGKITVEGKLAARLDFACSVVKPE